MATISLTGCAEWRGLQIDGSSVAAFEESISRLEQELPSAYRRQIFALALGDVAVDNKVAGYSDEDYRAQLDGLTYNGVIALADQTGASVKTQYYSRRTYAQVRAEQFTSSVLLKRRPLFPRNDDPRGNRTAVKQFSRRTASGRTTPNGGGSRKHFLTSRMAPIEVIQRIEECFPGGSEIDPEQTFSVDWLISR